MNWHLIKDRLIEKLQPNEALMEHIDSGSYRRAAVLIPFFFFRDEIYVLFTQRSDNLTTHSGDVCFPGGKKDEKDQSHIGTALRETYEEIGLHPSNVKVLCELLPYYTWSGIVITPVVGVIINIDRVSLQINTDEVADVFACPLRLFLGDNNYRKTSTMNKGSKVALHNFMWYKNTSFYDVNSNNEFYKRVFVDLNHETFVIWGLTAAIILLVASVCLDSPAVLHGETFTTDQLLTSKLLENQSHFGSKL